MELLFPMKGRSRYVLLFIQGCHGFKILSSTLHFLSSPRDVGRIELLLIQNLDFKSDSDLNIGQVQPNPILLLLPESKSDGIELNSNSIFFLYQNISTN